MPESSSTIEIASEIYELLKKELVRTGATTVDELASRVLRDWLTVDSPKDREERRLAGVDQEKLVERLKALGYV